MTGAEGFPLASGHALLAGVQRVTPRESTPRITTAAAGAVQSSVADLATWALFQLGDGTFGGRRILSAEVLSEMHAPQVEYPCAGRSKGCTWSPSAT